MTDEEKKALDDFLLSCRVSASDYKVKDIRRILIQFGDVIKKEITKVTLHDLRNFLVALNQSNKTAWTKHDIKSYIKRFIKFYYKDWSERFNGLKEVKNEKVGMNRQKINERTLLQKEDIETIMKKENDIVKKAFFIIMWETGARPSEVRKIKWSDIKMNEDGNLSEISIFMSKNKDHKIVFVKEGTFYLKKLLSRDTSDYVFPSQINKKMFISDFTATRWVKDMGKHINRNVYPYLIRHSRAQDLYDLVAENKVSINAVTETLGHSANMQKIYHKLSAKKLREIVTKSVFDLQELPPKEREVLQKQMEQMKEDLDKMKEQEKAKEEEFKKFQEMVIKNLKPLKGRINKRAEQDTMDYPLNIKGWNSRK